MREGFLRFHLKNPFNSCALPLGFECRLQHGCGMPCVLPVLVLMLLSYLRDLWWTCRSAGGEPCLMEAPRGCAAVPIKINPVAMMDV